MLWFFGQPETDDRRLTPEGCASTTNDKRPTTNDQRRFNLSADR